MFHYCFNLWLNINCYIFKEMACKISIYIHSREDWLRKMLLVFLTVAPDFSITWNDKITIIAPLDRVPVYCNALKKLTLFLQEKVTGQRISYFLWQIKISLECKPGLIHTMVYQMLVSIKTYTFCDIAKYIKFKA